MVFFNDDDICNCNVCGLCNPLSILPKSTIERNKLWTYTQQIGTCNKFVDLTQQLRLNF